jgi:DNA-binding PadR family transcriptional regulator
MSVKLIILGLLMSGDKHPYEMQHFVSERRIDKLIKFYKGSLYYAVDQLRKQELIEVVDVIKDDKRPDRTVYRITDSGREEFQKLLLEQFAKDEQFYDPLYTAVIFSRYGDKNKIQEIIEKRITFTEHKIKVLEEMFAERGPAISRPANYVYMSQIEYAKTTLRLLITFKEDIINGNINWDYSDKH